MTASNALTRPKDAVEAWRNATAGALHAGSAAGHHGHHGRIGPGRMRSASQGAQGGRSE
ncbi:hypothetical protein FRC12_019892, partial [Ceratobasidium sp. 428]